MKVVAVSQRVDRLSDRNETRDALDQRMITFLHAAGFISMPLPNVLCDPSQDGGCDTDALHAWTSAVGPKAFVLSGGNDIGQYPERDKTESYVLNHAKRHALPVLGICRGMQFMAHWAGTVLRPVTGHVRVRHSLSGRITGAANSYHDFALADCPKDFDILAKSEDGEIEAICHRSLPWEGWMWHPEREEEPCVRDLERIRALFGQPVA